MKPLAEALIRLRMSTHDAHYAGDLVDGVRMLGLFGDLATELLIRYDGDEGLFRTYVTMWSSSSLQSGPVTSSRPRPAS